MTVLQPRTRPARAPVALPILRTRDPFPAPDARPWYRRDLVLALPLTGLVVTVLAWNLGGFPGVGDDEGTYLAQAWAVREGAGLAHYTYWYDHPPLGWLQLAALGWLPELLAPDSSSVTVGRFTMLLPAAVSCLLVFTVARRMRMRRWTSGLAVLLFGLSPLTVPLLRQVYLDNLAVPWMLAAFALALSPRRHLWHHVAAGVCAAGAVLTKETLLIVVPALLYALYRGSDPSTRSYSFAGAITAGTLACLVYPLYALLRGELLPGAGHVSLWDGVVFQLSAREGSGAVWEAGSGARTALEQWLAADAVLLVGGCAAAVVALLVARIRPAAVAVLLLVVVALRPDGYLPQMYVIGLLPFLALCLAGTVDAVLDRVARATAYRPDWARATTRALTVAGVVLCAAALVAPRWHQGDRVATTRDGNDAYHQAAHWLRTSLPGDPARQRIVVDDTLWLDAVRGGAEPGLGAIWFYKVDLDPAVAAALPAGHRSLDYVVSSPIMRSDPNELPTVRAALRDSTVVVTFGSGDDRIEVRRVHGRVPDAESGPSAESAAGRDGSR